MTAESDVLTAMNNAKIQYGPNPDMGTLATLTGDANASTTYNFQLILGEVRALQAGVVALAKALDDR